MSGSTAAYRALRPLLFLTDSEWIHGVSLSLLAAAGANPPGRALLGWAGDDAPTDETEVMGLRFRNRIGLGAGFDKDGLAVRGWAGMGFGFVELGTVTPRPQSGNPRPRLWRLPADAALVNRMGFNNHGASALAHRLWAVRPRLPDGFVVGVNIGRNAGTPEAEVEQDYRDAAAPLVGVADYLVINVSSPNTPGLTTLQDPERLAGLTAAVNEAAPGIPLLVKLSSDLTDADFAAVLAALDPAPVAGLVLSNTTRARSGLRSPLPAGAQEGGLSGAPLAGRTVARVAAARRLSGARFALIASGGVGTALDATRLRTAGADLIQLWTGLVYRGPGLVGETDRAVRRRSGVEGHW